MSNPDGALTWDLNQIASALKISPGDTRDYFTDGRRVSFILERRLAHEILSGSLAPSGVTNVYNATGQNVQSYQVDHGQTNFYSPAGAYQGTATTPIYAAPNTTINAPRQAPVAPSVKGW